MDDIAKIKENINKLFSQLEEKVKEPIEETKQWSFKKALEGINVFKPVILTKWVITWIKVLVLALLIFGCIYGVGYWKGTHNKPIKIELNRGKEAYIKIDGHYLHITDEGYVYIEDEDGNKIKQIKVQDIKGLDEELRHYGFCLEPILVGGVGYGNSGVTGEIGVGVNWFYAWKLNIDSFLTNKGIYPLGISYSLKDLRLKNSAIGVAGGIGYDSFSGENDTRIIWYWRTKL